MIHNLRGTLTYTDAGFIVIECGGVGFKCFATLNTIKNIGKTGDEVNAYTHLSVREDAMDLYAFADKAELEAFKLLISISGVGPKAALAVLSELTPDKLALCVASSDSKSITRAQGVGKKIAERIVLELKDKMGGIVSEGASSAVIGAAGAAFDSTAGEAVEALVALGFQRSDASLAVGSMDKSLSVDEMIRLGLKQLSKNL